MGAPVEKSPWGFWGTRKRKSQRKGMKLLVLLLFAAPVLGQVAPGLYAYSDGSERVWKAIPGGFLLGYYREGRLFREDRLRLLPEGLYLEGLTLRGEYQAYTPPLLLYPARLFPGLSWGGSALFLGKRVGLSGRAQGVVGIRVPAGAFNAWLLLLAYATETGGRSLEAVYWVPGLGPVAFEVEGKRVELLRFRPTGP